MLTIETRDFLIEKSRSKPSLQPFKLLGENLNFVTKLSSFLSIDGTLQSTIECTVEAWRIWKKLPLQSVLVEKLKALDFALDETVYESWCDYFELREDLSDYLCFFYTLKATIKFMQAQSYFFNNFVIRKGMYFLVSCYNKAYENDVTKYIVLKLVQYIQDCVSGIIAKYALPIIIARA